MQVFSGRYGPYVKHGKVNATIPKDIEPEDDHHGRSGEADRGPRRQWQGAESQDEGQKRRQDPKAKSKAQIRQLRGFGLTNETEGACRKKSRARPETGLPSKDAILAFIRSSPTKIGKREIARAFNIKGDDRIRLKRLLRELADDGRVTKARKRLRGRRELRRSRVLEMAGQDENGELYAIPIDWDEAAEGPPPRILMRLKPGRAARHRRPCAVPHRAADRAPRASTTPARRSRSCRASATRQLGIFRKLKDGGVIEPIDKKQLREWRIAAGRNRRRRRMASWSASR